MSVLDFGRPVGAGHPPFIIAAVDCHELGSLERTLAAIDVAADNHCDAVKLARLPWDWSASLMARVEARGLMMLAIALDERMVERLDWLGAPAFYLVFDWSDLELVARAASTGKPLVLQVGTASEDELAEVIATARAHGDGGVALVQSVIDIELDGLDALGRHGEVVGISDRSACSAIPRAAISRGASIVEKRLGAADLASSQIGTFVRDCELAWAAIGEPRWTIN